jgi:hypothetical protein
MSFFGVPPLITPFCIFKLFLCVLLRCTALITHFVYSSSSCISLFGLRSPITPFCIF